MKTLTKLSFILLFVFLTSSAFAQKSSGWSLLFSWDRFNAGAFPAAEVYTYNGENLSFTDLAGIGIEFELTPVFTIQGAFHFSTSSWDEKQGTTTIKTTNTAYGVGIGPFWYPRGYNTNAVRPYLGAAVRLGGISYTQEAGTAKVDASFSSFGFVLMGGADFEVLSGFRVGAGYGLMYASYPAGTLEETNTAGQVTKLEGPSGSALSTFFHLNCKIIL
jgi:hypothetical protein